MTFQLCWGGLFWQVGRVFRESFPEELLIKQKSEGWAEIEQESEGRVWYKILDCDVLHLRKLQINNPKFDFWSCFLLYKDLSTPLCFIIWEWPHRKPAVYALLRLFLLIFFLFPIIISHVSIVLYIYKALVHACHIFMSPEPYAVDITSPMSQMQKWGLK